MTARINESLELLENDLLVELEDDEQIYYFYDYGDNFEKLKQRDMPTREHNSLKAYLIEVLSWQYNQADYEIYDEFNFYTTTNQEEEPLYPDIAVVKNFTHVEGATSYHVNVTCPAPSIIIELISTKTRTRDIASDQKPQFYANWGTKEYFAYDPRPRKRKLKMRRLWGWQLRDGVPYEMKPDKQGRLWSNELDSWLVPAGAKLRLYDKDNNLRLTELEFRRREAEAQYHARLAAERRERDALSQVEQERLAKEQERLAKEQERLAKEAAFQRLRELGIDPDKL
jgi:Uma2 family endonuclease